MAIFKAFLAIYASAWALGFMGVICLTSDRARRALRDLWDVRS